MRLIQVIAGPEPFHCVSFDAEGRTLNALSGDRKRLHHFDPETGLERDAPVPVSLDDRGGTILEFGDRGRTLWCINMDHGSLRFFDAATGVPRCEPIPTRPPGAEVRVSPDGDAVASPSGIDTIRVWSAATGGPLGPPIRIDATADIPYALGPHGRTLLTFGARGLQLRDVATGRLARSWASPSKVYLAGFNPEGEFFTIKNADRAGSGPELRNEIEFWDERGSALDEPPGDPQPLQLGADRVGSRRQDPGRPPRTRSVAPLSSRAGRVRPGRLDRPRRRHRGGDEPGWDHGRPGHAPWPRPALRRPHRRLALGRPDPPGPHPGTPVQPGRAAATGVRRGIGLDLETPAAPATGGPSARLGRRVRAGPGSGRVRPRCRDIPDPLAEPLRRPDR